MLRGLHHSKTRWMHAGVIWLRFSLLFSLLATLLVCRVLLLLAVALLHLELSALFSVAGALVVEFVILGYDARFAVFAVAAASSTRSMLVKSKIDDM
jgi:hypothetical protein